MTWLLLNGVLALGWAALWGSFAWPILASGFAVGYGALWIVRPLFGETTYFGRVWSVTGLALFFLYELVVSSLRVVWDVITPSHRSRPGIIAVPLDAKDDGQIMMVANLVSLTPGSLSLDVSDDRKTLYVHAMFIDDPEESRREIKDGLERKVLEAFN